MELSSWNARYKNCNIVCPKYTIENQRWPFVRGINATNSLCSCVPNTCIQKLWNLAQSYVTSHSFLPIIPTYIYDLQTGAGRCTV